MGIEKLMDHGEKHDKKDCNGCPARFFCKENAEDEKGLSHLASESLIETIFPRMVEYDDQDESNSALSNASKSTFEQFLKMPQSDEEERQCIVVNMLNSIYKEFHELHGTIESEKFKHLKRKITACAIIALTVHLKLHQDKMLKAAFIEAISKETKKTKKAPLVEETKEEEEKPN